MSSISMQRQAVEHCLALLESAMDGHDAVIATARDACRTLAWFERRSELVRALVDLEKRAPGLAELAQEFPGTRIEINRVKSDEALADGAPHGE